MKKFFTRRKRIVFLILIIVCIFLLVIKSCGQNTKTSSVDKYITHIEKSINTSKNNKKKLVGYLNDSSDLLLECDEDVANQIEAFSKAFREEANNYKSLVYIGNEQINGHTVYINLSNSYEELSTTLGRLANAIRSKDIDKVSNTFEELREQLKAIEKEELVYETN